MMASLPELSLAAEHRRGHGGLYAGLAHGRVDVDRMRRAVIAGPLPRLATQRGFAASENRVWRICSMQKIFSLHAKKGAESEGGSAGAR